MASTSGATAELEQLQAKLEEYEADLKSVKAKILYLEQQQSTDESREELKCLRQEKQSLLDLLKELQHEKNLLLGLSAGAAAAGAAVVIYDNGLSDWAAQLLAIQERDGCLRQVEGLPLSLPPLLRRHLYIRLCYQKLWSLLWDRSSEGTERKGFIVTGTPGIGKSAFALYLLKQLGEKQQLVYYEYEDVQSRGAKRLKFDFRAAPVEASCISNLAGPDVDFFGSAWHIIEGRPHPGLEFDGGRNTVVLASPNHNNFYTFRKGRGCQLPLYLPVWSLPELEACRQRLYPEIGVEAAQERFTWFGGSIRRVLAEPGSDPEEQLRQAVMRRSHADIQQL